MSTKPLSSVSGGPILPTSAPPAVDAPRPAHTDHSHASPFRGETPAPQATTKTGLTPVALRALVAGPATKEQVYQDVAKMFPDGLVDEAELTETLSFLNDCYGKMVEQFARNPEEYPGIAPGFTSEIVVARSNQANAFAGVTLDDKTGCATGSVTIVTSAMIADFINVKGLSKLDTRQRLLALVGVIAHELAHSVDKGDPKGIEATRDTGGRSGASIALEMRTDYEAQKLLRKAGLPVSSLFYGAQILQHTQTLFDRANSMVSTHPEITFRSAFQRGSMTGMRMHFGEVEDDIELSETVAAKIVDETKVFFDDTSFTPPKSLEELDKSLSILPLARLNQAEFNAAVMWFDHHLASHPNLDLADPALNAIRRKIMAYPHHLSDSPAGLQSLIEEAQLEGFEEIPKKPHFDYVRTLPFYSDPSLADGVVDMRLDLTAYGERGNGLLNPRTRPTKGGSFANLYDVHYHDKFGHNLALGFAPAVIKSHLAKFRGQKAEAQQLEKHYAYLIDLPSLKPDDIFLPPADFVDYNTEFHNHVIDGFVAQTNLLESDGPFCHFDYRYAVPTQQSHEYWRDLLAPHGSSKTAASAKSILQSIWDKRGMWASMEFLSNKDFHIDWALIGQALGIPRDTMKRELQVACQDYIDQQIDKAAPQGGVAVSPMPRTPPSWMSAGFAKFLRQRIAKQPDATQKEDLRWTLSARHMGYFPEVRTKALESEFAARIAKSLPSTVEDILALWQSTQLEVLGRAQFKDHDAPPDKIEIVWKTLRAAQLPRPLLEKFALEMIASQTFTYARGLGPKNTEAVAQAWIDVGLARTVVDVVDYFRQAEDNKWSVNPEAYAGYTENNVKNFIVQLTNALVRETETSQGARSDEEALGYLHQTAELMDLCFAPNEFTHSRELARAFISDLADRSLDTQELVDAFTKVTRFATNSETDSFFRQHVLPKVLEAQDPEDLRRLVKKGCIRSSTFQVELAERVIGDRWNTESAPNIIAELNEMLPKASNAKDAFLEKLAWHKQITGEPLVTLIEEEKSLNWRRPDPAPLIYNASITEMLKLLSPAKRARLVEYLIVGPKAEAILDELIQDFKNDTESKFARSYKVVLHAGYTTEDKINMQMAEVRSALVNLVNDSAPLQRVPVVEYLLTIGDDNIACNDRMMNDLLKRHLNLQPGSPEYAVMRAYLDVIPEHERDLTLSYLLVNSNDSDAESDTMNMRSLFEVFGTAGIKFGQLAAVWDIFGPEYKEQLEGLFDNAAPLSKHEIETLLKQEMGDAYGSIKRVVKVLGSASIKTVALAELQNGKKVALMIQRPNARGQTKTNLKAARKFLNRLQHYALQSSNPIFDPLVEAVENQIPSELDLQQEMENIKQTRAVVAQINRQLASESEGWTVGVPDISEDVETTEHVFGMKAVAGVSAKEFMEDATIPQAERDRVGQMMTKTALRMLFRHGTFDPDRHPGNWIIDRDTKEIHFIDAGQLVNFETDSNMLRSDDRLAIGRFLQAISNKNGQAVVDAALAMRKDGADTPVDSAAVAQAIDAAVDAVSDEAPESETLKAIVTALYGAGVELDENFTFGGLKGLLTLGGSHYVSDEAFADILRAEIKTLFLKKAPAVVAQQVRQFFRQES